MDRAGKYIARTFISVHGRKVAPGGEIYLSHEDAERAIAQGTVEVAKPAAPSGPSGPARHPEDVRHIERLRESLSDLGDRYEKLGDDHARVCAELGTVRSQLEGAQKRVTELEEMFAQATAPSTTTTLAQGDSTTQGGEKPQGHAQAQAKGNTKGTK